MFRWNSTIYSSHNLDFFVWRVCTHPKVSPHGQQTKSCIVLVGLKGVTKSGRKWTLEPGLVLGVISFLQGFSQLLGYLFTTNHGQVYKKHHHKLKISLGRTLANENAKEDLTTCYVIGQPKRGTTLLLLFPFLLQYSDVFKLIKHTYAEFSHLVCLTKLTECNQLKFIKLLQLA